MVVFISKILFTKVIDQVGVFIRRESVGVFGYSLDVGKGIE